MKRFTSILSLVAILGLCTNGIAQQVNDVDPGGNLTTVNNNSSRALGDLVSGPFDVETAVYDNRCLGVEEAWGSLWITGRGHTTLGDNYMIHEYDMTGNWITSYPQNVSAGNTGGWGGRDMEADDAANTLWVGNDTGYVEVMSYDPVTGALSYSNTVITAVSGTVRALCQNPTSGNFFTKSFTGDVFEFDMTTGAVVNAWVNAQVSAYGFGWDYVNGTIWSTDVQCSATELDPATAQGTGRFFTTGGVGIGATAQGGADVYNDPLNPNGPTMVMLGQGAPDSVASYDTSGSGGPPPAVWPNLPTTFIPAAHAENFDSHAGVVPSHMGINELDAFGLPTASAWCNIGQRGPCGQGTGTYVGVWAGSGSGAYCLEMGGDPLGPTGIQVRNGLIMGLDGSGAGDLLLDFGIVNHGEENHPWDGVWVSSDGLAWNQVYGPWFGMAVGAWINVAGVDISNSGVDTNGQFYLLFAQEDNFPMAYLDGIQIDDISIAPVAPPGPTLSVNPLIAGQASVVSLDNCTPNNLAYFVYSLAGGGPINTPFGPGYVSSPYKVIPLPTDANGHAGVTKNVPAGTTGLNIWFHGADRGSQTMLNPLAMTIG